MKPSELVPKFSFEIATTTIIVDDEVIDNL